METVQIYQSPAGIQGKTMPYYLRVNDNGQARISLDTPGFIDITRDPQDMFKITTHYQDTPTNCTVALSGFQPGETVLITPEPSTMLLLTIGVCMIKKGFNANRKRVSSMSRGT